MLLPNARCWLGYEVPAAMRNMFPPPYISWGFREQQSSEGGTMSLHRVRTGFHLKIIDTQRRERIVGPFEVPSRQVSFPLRIVLRD